MQSLYCRLHSCGFLLPLMHVHTLRSYHAPVQHCRCSAAAVVHTTIDLEIHGTVQDSQLQYLLRCLHVFLVWHQGTLRVLLSRTQIFPARENPGNSVFVRQKREVGQEPPTHNKQNRYIPDHARPFKFIEREVPKNQRGSLPVLAALASARPKAKQLQYVGQTRTKRDTSGPTYLSVEVPTGPAPTKR